MAKRATIDDVAALARVSIKTVSRVANREPNVSAATQARVERAIAALKYRASPAARNLAAQRSFLVGLLYDDQSASVSYIMGIQSGMLAAVERANFQMLIHRCSFDQPSLVAGVLDLVRRSRLEGLVLTPPLSDVAALARALDQEHIACVRIAPGRMAPPGQAVYSNDRSVCAQMTEHLVSLGHRRIGFVVGHRRHAAVATRYSGYRDALARCGLTLDERLVAHGQNSFESGIDCGRQLLSCRPRPTAIFASNDDMAAGVLFVAHELGLEVPQELSIAGFDDIPLARQTWPALTTIRQPISELAQRATQMLLGRLSDAPAADAGGETIDSAIVLRGSTGPARGRSVRSCDR